MSEKITPKGWAIAPLGDICVEKVEQREPGDDAVPYIDIGSIDRGTKAIGELPHVTRTDAPTRARQSVRARDVLVSMTRPNLNAVALVPQNLDGAIASTGFDVLRPIEILSEWVFNRVRSHDFVAGVSEGLQGVVYPAIRPHDVRKHECPIPPLPEQKRIVEAIESYFSRLDDTVATLERVQRNLKRYRASVLKAAVEGRLVPTEAELARTEGRDYEPASALLHDGDREKSAQKKRAGRLWGAGVVPELHDVERAALPEGWCWAKVRDLGPVPGEVVQVGPMSMRSKDFAETGVTVLNVGCVQWGYIDESRAHRLPAPQAEKFGRYRVESGDVLFTRSGTVGRTAVARQQHSGSLITFHLLRARPSADRCLPEYLQIVFEGAPHVRRQTREASIGTTRAGFNTMLLALLDVPLPPLAEQRRIVDEVARLLSEVDDTRACVTRDLRRCARLRQSILKWAFEGKLADQDSSDEPASALLERIRLQTSASRQSASDADDRRRRRRGSRSSVRAKNPP